MHPGDGLVAALSLTAGGAGALVLVLAWGMIAGRGAMIRAIVYLALALWAAASLFPLGWMILSAFVDPERIKTTEVLLVRSMGDLSLENFRVLLRHASIGRWLLNSLAVALTVTVVQLLIDAMAGWALARRKFPGRGMLMGIIVLTMMVPGQILTVPLFMMMARMRLLDSLWAVILPSLAGPFGIFYLKQHCETLPRELEDAALVDGCSDWGIFWSVVVPLSWPVLATLGTFLFMSHWNAFLWPLIVLFSSAGYTLPVGLATLQGQHEVDFGLLMAGATLSAIPMIAVFLCFSRLFIDELAAGAVKG